MKPSYFPSTDDASGDAPPVTLDIRDGKPVQHRDAVPHPFEACAPECTEDHMLGADGKPFILDHSPLAGSVDDPPRDGPWIIGASRIGVDRI